MAATTEGGGGGAAAASAPAAADVAAAAPAAAAAYAPAAEGLVYFRPPTARDHAAVCAIEAASYPPDEAATPERLAYRIERANAQFLLAVRRRQQQAQGQGQGQEEDEEVLGFVCGTLSREPRLTHASMGAHDADGTNLCIHSVAVAPAHRRRGIARRLLAAYLAAAPAASPQITHFRLICKEHLTALYERAGFRLVGPSPVEHGADPWLEFAMDLAPPGE